MVRVSRDPLCSRKNIFEVYAAAIIFISFWKTVGISRLVGHNFLRTI